MKKKSKTFSVRDCWVCATTIVQLVEAKSFNWKSDAELTGKTMRELVAGIAKRGVTLDDWMQAPVDKAEAYLKEYCDGQDCSRVSIG